MNPGVAVFAFAIILLTTILGVTRYIERSRSKKLHEQAGLKAIHGEAAHSLKTEEMRIRKSNRDKGVIGELGVAKDLDYLAHKYGLTVMHDLSIPGTKANIDHILLSRKVIYVIDAKNYTGIVNVAPNRAGKKTLRVGGRDQSVLVSKVSNYALSVSEYLKLQGIQVKIIPLLAFHQARFHQDSAHSVDGVTVNVFGIENELMRYANLKSKEIDVEAVAKLILEKFPYKK